MSSSPTDRRKAANLLVTLRSRGIKVWRDVDRLRYQAPQGSLSADDLEALGAAKADLIELLQLSSSGKAVTQQIGPRLPFDEVPLTFGQKLFWNCLQLEERPSVRAIAGAWRLTGPLNITCMRECFSELVRRHESLRTRIVAIGGVPRQIVDAPTDYELETSDLSGVSSGDQAEGIRKRLERIVNEPFAVQAGPLFAATLIKLRDEEYVLAVAMDHIISDIASLGIVWREIFSLYPHILRGLPCELPGVYVQFADYAVWQQRTEQAWAKQHAAYWEQRLAVSERLAPLEHAVLAEKAHIGWRRQRVHFTDHFSDRLRKLRRERKTSSAMITLAAYVAFLLRWSEVTAAVIPFTNLGRHQAKLDSTIGYFAIPLYLRVETRADDTFPDLLDRLIEEYCVAYECSDCGRLAAATPTPGFVWNPRFNWIPEDLGMGDRETQALKSDACLKVEPYSIEILARDDIEWEEDSVLEMSLSEGEGGVAGFLTYRGDRFAQQNIERFVRSFELFAEHLLSQPVSTLQLLSSLSVTA